MALQYSGYFDRIALFFRFEQLGTNYRTELLASFASANHDWGIDDEQRSLN